MGTVTIQIRRKGVITLPVELRRRYGLDEGDAFVLEDLGDGTFLLVPRLSQVARLGDRVAEMMEQEGVSTQEVLEALEQERESYYQQHYAQS
jgi:AbrB family looped-hinge helix DNA binding protein